LTEPLLSVDDLRVEFWTERGTIHAVNGISFDVGPGETLGIVGESGCGKSTTARLIMQIITPDAGDILFDGEAVGSSALRRVAAAPWW